MPRKEPVVVDLGAGKWNIFGTIDRHAVIGVCFVPSSVFVNPGIQDPDRPIDGAIYLRFLDASGAEALFDAIDDAGKLLENVGLIEAALESNAKKERAKR